MSKNQLEKKYSKMNSTALLNNILKGEKRKKEATVMATIVERRFPTPVKPTKH